MNSGRLVLRRQWPLDVRHTAYLLAACIAALLGVIVASRPGPAPVGVPRASSVARSPHELAELAFPEQAAVARTIGGSDRTYWVRRSAGGLSALGAGLTTSFRAAGVVVRADGRSAGLSLGAVGRGAALAPVAAAIPRASHNRVVYDRGSLQEWYANGPAGLEQGFRLARRPAASAAGALTLSLALSGGLHAALDANQLGLTLRTAAGRAVLRYTGLSATDALGHRLAAHLALRGERVLIVVDDAHARYPIAVDPFVQSALLIASKGDPGQYIGSSVAASADGRTLAIAGPNAGLGVIYVFTEPTGGWTNMTQTTELHTPSSVNSNPPWGLAMSANAETIVWGPYVYTRPSQGWVGTVEVKPVTLGAGEGSGQTAVAISGNTIVQGQRATYVAGHTTYGQGALYVFVEPEGGWKTTETATARLLGSGEAEEYFGTAVAIEGEIIVTSAPKHGSDGALDLFKRPPGGWASTETPTAELSAPGAGGTEIGAEKNALAMSGGTIVAGSWAPYVGGTETEGSADVFEEPETGWANTTEATAKLTGEGEAYEDFGASVAVDGRTIAVGARTTPTAQEGAIYVFSEPAPGWEPTTAAETLTPSHAESGGFGDALAIGAGTILAGAPTAVVEEVGPGVREDGDAYVFFGPPPAPPSAVIGSPVSGGSFEQGSVVHTGFSCVEGAGGPGLESCVDSNGVSGGVGTLATSVVGVHSYSVMAKSVDGQSASAEIGYTVTAAKVAVPVETKVVPVETAKVVEEVLLGCGKRALVLNDVLVRGGRVELTGSAASSLDGKQVSIVFGASKTVASVTVGSNGAFSASVPLPSAKLRDSNSARYTAVSGAQRSLSLKLTRRLSLESLTVSGGSVVLSGQVVLPLAHPVALVTVQQQLECGTTREVLKFKPAANGRFHVSVPVPAGAKAAIYRLTTSVRESTRSRHSFATYSLPLPIALD